MEPTDETTEGTGPVLVCGLQPIGLRIVEQLHRSGVPVVVIDDDPDRRLLPTLEEWKVPFVLGSPRQRSVLLGAGLSLAIAVICVEDDDLRTLESALVVHDLRPELRVVAGIANPSVGRALGSVIGPDRVLDVAALAAPSLVQACLGTPIFEVPIEDVDFVVLSEESQDACTLRERYGDLVPLAVIGKGDGTLEVCPGRDHRVGPGDMVTMIGTPAELASAGVDTHVEAEAEAESRRRRRPLMPVLPEFPGALRLALAAIVAVVTIATVVLSLAYRTASGAHIGVLNALYFTVVTISTVGFGDYSFRGQTPWLRGFAIVLIITGVVLATTLFATITNTLFSRSIANALGRQRVTRMRGHVVIIGLGSIGVRVVEGLLARNRPVVAIERDDHNRHLARARALGVPILYGDATETATLDAANTQAASAVAALTSDDLTNVQTGLVLREYLADAGARETPTVLRLFHRDLSVILERDFSFHAVRSTADLAAPWFLGAALGLGITSTFYVSDQLFLVANLTVGPAGGLVGLPMADLGVRIRVIAISHPGGEDGGAGVGGGRVHGGRREVGDSGGARHGTTPARRLEHPVRRGARFAAGDRAYLIGPYEELLAVLRRDATRS